jgi:hypothetical protein
MGKRGVEPLRLAALEPKSSVSAISPLALKKGALHPSVANNISQRFAVVKTEEGQVFCVRSFDRKPWRWVVGIGLKEVLQSSGYG